MGSLGQCNWSRAFPDYILVSCPDHILVSCPDHVLVSCPDYVLVSCPDYVLVSCPDYFSPRVQKMQSGDETNYVWAVSTPYINTMEYN